MRRDTSLRAQFGERDTHRQRDAPIAPVVQPLMGEAEMASDQGAADLVDQRAVGEGLLKHVSVINAALIFGKPLSLIELHETWFLTVGMANLGRNIQERLDEMGIAQTDLAKATGLSTQRLNNYIRGSRPPDVDSLAKIAKALRVSTDYLLGLSDAGPTDMRAVVLRLLELDGMAVARAETIADAAARAVQLLSSLPGEGEARTRALLAAQAAWQTRLQSKPS